MMSPWEPVRLSGRLPSFVTVQMSWGRGVVPVVVNPTRRVQWTRTIEDREMGHRIPLNPVLLYPVIDISFV